MQLGSQKVVSQLLPRPMRHCLYACALANNSGEARDNLDGFAYMDLSDHYAVFQNADTLIIAFRGTDAGNDIRFLGAHVLSEAQKRLPYESRAKILSPYCPADAVVGCANVAVASAVDTNLAVVPTYKTDLAGGLNQVYLKSRYGPEASGPLWSIDSSSDCWADKQIAYRDEVNSRLHQLMASQVQNLVNRAPKRVQTIYITGHSLGGNLAAFCAYNYVGPRRSKLSVVLFDPGSGPGRSLIGRFLHRIPVCPAPTLPEKVGPSKPELVDGRSVQGPIIRPSKDVFVPFPMKASEWDIPIVCFREDTDAFSYMSTSWWPTVNFRFRKTPRYLGVTFHSICNFFTDAEYKALVGYPFCKTKDSDRFVESYIISGI
jgi:hypothetical protein